MTIMVRIIFYVRRLVYQLRNHGFSYIYEKAASFLDYSEVGTRTLPCYDQLQEKQNIFIKRCESFGFLRGKDSESKNLIFLQFGKGQRNGKVFRDKNSSWDLIVNHYDQTQLNFFDASVSQIIPESFPAATKFLAYFLLVKKYPEILHKYDFVCFMDDDVEISTSNLQKLFSEGKDLRLDLFQACVSDDSEAEWPVLKRFFGGKNRYLQFTSVEVMAPVISRRLIKVGLSVFEKSISTWGIDFALSSLVTKKLNTYPTVLYGVEMAHRKKSDQLNGAFYKMLQSQGIDAKSELGRIRKEYGISFSKIRLR